jgi:hypothetical protein
MSSFAWLSLLAMRGDLDANRIGVGLQAAAALRTERERHLRVGALYAEAKDIIAARQLHSRSKGSSSSLPGVTSKVYDAMHNVFLAAEVTQSLELEPRMIRPSPHKSCDTLLGLKKEDIELAIASKAPSKFAEVCSRSTATV